MTETPETDTPDQTTNATTARLATQNGQLPLGRLQLIGVVGSQDTRRALLRQPNGQIETVHLGDQLRQGTVVAIDDDAVILSTATGTRRLDMPAPPQAPPVAA